QWGVLSCVMEQIGSTQDAVGSRLGVHRMQLGVCPSLSSGKWLTRWLVLLAVRFSLAGRLSFGGRFLLRRSGTDEPLVAR
ncbi:hypothetical protein AVEN_177393-1, partial [Araneus ventricosus]